MRAGASISPKRLGAIVRIAPSAGVIISIGPRRASGGGVGSMAVLMALESAATRQNHTRLIARDAPHALEASVRSDAWKKKKKKKK
jgi:hypothetical protein